MKKILFLVIVIILNLSCSKDENQLHRKSQDGLPGKYFGKIAFDSKGKLWLETSEIDTTVHLPSYSSSIPIRIYLSSFWDNSYEVYDDRFMGAKEIVTDKYDRLWFITRNKVYLLDNDKYVNIYEIDGTDGYFEWIKPDQEMNLWVGGWKAPLLKISLDPNIKISNLSNNSTAANTSAGCFDKNNNLWVILSTANIGSMDVSGGWRIYSPDNSSLPYQTFWCITADKDNNIWAGTGFPGTGVNLVKFNGSFWEPVTIKDENGTPIHGTVRQLYSDNKRLWIVVEYTNANMFSNNFIVTFDGVSWRKINEVPSDDGITDIEFDYTTQKACVATMNKGLFEVAL
jgi:hypothetical protein